MKRIFRQIHQHTVQLFNLLTPTTCLLCGCAMRGDLLCAACELALPHLPIGGQCCQQCALPLKTSADYCGQCLHKPPAFSRTIIPFRYEYPLDYLIHSFKYRRQLTAGRVLGRALENCLQHTYSEQDWPIPDLIIPVPLHWRRRWLRGFNQTEIIGHHLSRQLGIPLYSHLCRRTRHTPTQKGLSRTARQKNLRQLFRVARKGRPIIEGKTVVLLDDVVTTTATTREISRLLIQQGARDVHVWALARTPDFTPD